MPYKLKRPCNKPGCPNLTDRKDGYCEQHAGWGHRIYKQCRMDKAEQGLYQSAQWRKLRALKLARDPLCEPCLKADWIKPAELVHHRQPIKQGGDPFAWDNLESICVSCHNKAETHGR